MTDKLRASTEDLRRLVAADWWEWVPGMWVKADGFQSAPLILAGGQTFYIGANALPVDAARCLPWVVHPATAGCLLELYLRDSKPDLALAGLSATRPGPDAYASFGDFLVAVLLKV